MEYRETESHDEAYQALVDGLEVYDKSSPTTERPNVPAPCAIQIDADGVMCWPGGADVRICPRTYRIEVRKPEPEKRRGYCRKCGHPVWGSACTDCGTSWIEPPAVPEGYDPERFAVVAVYGSHDVDDECGRWYEVAGTLEYVDDSRAPVRRFRKSRIDGASGAWSVIGESIDFGHLSVWSHATGRAKWALVLKDSA